MCNDSPSGRRPCVGGGGAGVELGSGGSGAGDGVDV